MESERWSADLRARAHRFQGLFARIVALLVLALLGALPARANSGWELCNETSFILEAAVGRPEGKGVVVEGWTRIRPGECRVAMPAPLKAGVHFVFAKSSPAHRGGQRQWNGDIPLCVDPAGSFAVESPNSCTAMGLESRGFSAVRIDRRDKWRTRLFETEPYGLARARPAGIQRLLTDAGIENANVDGYLGRTSRNAIAAFLAEKKMPANLSEAELIDILEDVARNRSIEVGMMLCNRTTNRIWSAIARPRSDGWESRGWWTIEAGACVRTIDEPLISTAHYVFAEMETPEGVRRLSNAKSTFCTARSKFAIIGREDCSARAYRQHTFLETDTPVDGKLVYEFWERGFGPAIRPEPKPAARPAAATPPLAKPR